MRVNKIIISLLLGYAFVLWINTSAIGKEISSNVNDPICWEICTGTISSEFDIISIPPKLKAKGLFDVEQQYLTVAMTLHCLNNTSLFYSNFHPTDLHILFRQLLL